MKKSSKELLGARIKELRKAKKLSQEQLSEKVGIDPKHLSRIEVGRGFPSLDTLEKLATALAVELKDFFEFAHSTKNKKELRESLCSLANEADEEKLRLAVKILRALVR
ncbi:MAG: helix-turn-helix domain-containing protein [Nitrospinae bacterium]|nr:helix-turn-helix domain-containing protein [Nitrospinota bacterium]